MATKRGANSFEGYGRSDAFPTTILSGAATPAATLDLLRNYAYLVVSCLDASGIAVASKLQLKVAEDTGNTIADLWTSDGAALWQSGVLPISGTFRFVIPSAFGVQLVKPALTVVSTANVILTFYGFDPTLQGQ